MNKFFMNFLIPFLNIFLKINPNSAFLYYLRAHANLVREEQKLAETDFSSVINIAPKKIEAYTGRGFAKNFLKDYEGSIKDCNRAIELNPNEAMAYHIRAGAKFKMFNFRSSIEDYDQVIKIEPDFVLSSELYFNRALAKYEINDIAGAIEDLNISKKLGNENVDNVLKKIQ